MWLIKSQTVLYTFPGGGQKHGFPNIYQIYDQSRI